MAERDTPRAPEPVDVCLLSMPYPILNQPSLALGLLKAALADTGIRARTLYPCLGFAEEIGLDAYSFLCESKQEFLAGEWTFAGVAFPDFEPDHDSYLSTVLGAPVSRGLQRRSGYTGDPGDALWHAREAAPAFVERVAREVLELRPKIVGCTSTFMQHVASLALLRVVRELAPEVVTVLGGANCEGPMGRATRRCFPWVDFVVSGEGDRVFPELCRRVLEAGRDLPPSELPPAVLGPGHPALTGSAEVPRASVFGMDGCPVPDFDDYFAALAGSPLSDFIVPALPVETSRGCWWGAKHHCTFCGLNGGNMEFRSKSPDRVVRELASLSERYGIRKFNVVDNILDLGYIESVLPRLAAEEPYGLFFETKANLRRDQLATIAAAGIRRLQPGLESMHDGVLRLVDKGTTALQNVQLLKWAREIGVFITWNFLWDVPGEEEAWYEEMAGWLPWVSHLQPPGVDRIQFHRFSPYHFRAGDFGLTLAPYPLYRAIYPVAEEELGDLAYYFDSLGRPSTREELDRRPHLRRVMGILGTWNRLWGQGGLGGGERRPVVLLRPEGERVVVEDTRPCAVAPVHEIDGLPARLLGLADGIQTTTSLARKLPAGSADGAQVAAAVADLEERRLLLRLNGKLLGLALREVRPIPESREDFPGGYIDLQAFARAAGDTRLAVASGAER